MEFVVEQHVRFEEQCVLIPDPAPSSRLPRLVTKSYSLPLWRRKGSEPPPCADAESAQGAKERGRHGILDRGGGNRFGGDGALAVGIVAAAWRDGACGGL